MPAPLARTLTPFAAALGLAIVGCVAAPALTSALGYGADAQPLRLAAVAVAFFVGGAVAFRPGRSWEMRLAGVLVSATVAAAAWEFAPSTFSGMSLATAAAKRDAVRSQIAAPPTFDDVGRVEYIGPALAFAAEYPALAASVQPGLREWGGAAAEQVADRYRTVSPGDASAVHTVMNRAALLTLALPDTTASVEAAENAFAARSAAYWTDELNAVAPGHFTGYRFWVNRRDAATGIRSHADTLQAAERAWVERSVDAAIARADHLRLFMPARGREDLVRACADLRSLAEGTPATADVCRAARFKVYSHALTRSQAEAQAFLDAGAADRAAEIARDHADEWSEEAPLLSREAAARVARFRDGCRYLSDLVARTGGTGDFAPVPRPRP